MGMALFFFFLIFLRPAKTTSDLLHRQQDLCKRCPFMCRSLWLRGEPLPDFLSEAWLPRCSNGTKQCGLQQFVRNLNRTRVRPNSLPSFLIIGAQKAGTTDLFSRLLQYSFISGPNSRTQGRKIFSPQGFSGFAPQPAALDKEVHFFDHCIGASGGKSRTSQLLTQEPMSSVDWCDVIAYESVFQQQDEKTSADSSIYFGEASPSYLMFPELASIVHSVVPNVKIIAMLRDPVERAYSSYFQGQSAFRYHKSSPEVVPFRVAIQRELQILEDCKTINIKDRWMSCIWPRFLLETLEETLTSHGPWNSSYEFEANPRRCTSVYVRKKSLLIRGLYAFHLIPWFQFFDKQQFLVIESSEYFGKAHILARDVARFISTGNASGFSGMFGTKNSRVPPDKHLSHELKRELQGVFQPYNEYLYQVLSSHDIQFTPFNVE
eukprot:m.119239 g.119239  ORF g.119239 m.119239 type:complete len:434 (-) comp14308_c0_seq8:65-1366(-)